MLDELDRAGLRGRGGAGFPAGRKWRSVATGGAALGDRYVVANGAEGEPGTFKDRPLLRANPYQVLEGLSVAASVVGAREAFVAVKASFAPEIAALERALREMADAGPARRRAGQPDRRTRGVPLRRGEGAARGHRGQRPDAALAPALPARPVRDDAAGRMVGGLGHPSTERRGAVGSNPTLVTNVETLANVPLIVDRGADWYRAIGTARDARAPALHGRRRRRARRASPRSSPGTTLREVIERVGGGVRAGRTAKAVLSGVSNPVLTAAHLDAPVSYEGLAAAGGGLGSAGFIVYDDSRSMVSVAQMVSRFLYVESCGQCRACKFGCGEITRQLDEIAEPRAARCTTSRPSARACSGSPTRTAASSAKRSSASSRACCGRSRRTSPLQIEQGQSRGPAARSRRSSNIDDGVATYDEMQMRKQPDWTYASPR